MNEAKYFREEQKGPTCGLTTIRNAAKVVDVKQCVIAPRTDTCLAALDQVVSDIIHSTDLPSCEPQPAPPFRRDPRVLAR